MTHRAAKFWFIAPAIAWIAAFAVAPVLSMFPKSFQEARRSPSGGIEMQWVAWRHFEDALSDAAIRRSIGFSTAAASLAVVIEVACGLSLALIAHRVLHADDQWTKSIYAIPILAAPVAVAYLSLSFFDQSSGLVNLLLGQVMESTSLPRWRTSSSWSLTAVVLIDVWQWTPFCFLVLLGSMEIMPRQLLEAANVEGAGAWSQIRWIVLPLCAPAIVLVLLIRSIEALKIFDVPLVLTGGGPGTQTYTYTQWIWRYGLREANIEKAAAMSLLLLVPVTVASTFFLARMRRSFAPPHGG